VPDAPDSNAKAPVPFRDFYALSKALASGDDRRIREAQAALGVKVDGDPGPKTWAALEAIRPPQARRIVLPNPKAFFDTVRPMFRGDTLTPAQVSGMNHLLAAWADWGTPDVRHLAYALATSFHETGQRMNPVREGFATSDAAARRIVSRYTYGKTGAPRMSGSRRRVTNGLVYYGRGDVQLTWADNYARMGAVLGIDLEGNPDLALDPATSKRILVEGLTRGASNRGDFTGLSVEDFFNASKNDPVGARRVVNGTDKAREIAGYHAIFLRGLRAGGAA